jgi:hypothetical protein
MPELPSQRQERFCQYAVTGMTDEQAYAAAGYKPNRGNPRRLKAKDSIRQRIAEIQREISSKTQQVVVEQDTITRQYLVDALIENIEKSLGRQPVKIGADGVPTYTYRGEVANNGIKMAGGECGMFKDKAEVTHRMDFDDLSDEQLLLRLRDETEALLLEKRAAGILDNGGAEG